MADCDNCGDGVIHVWRHRSLTETMTHSEISWLCTDCHPELPDVRNHEETEGGEGVPVTDGGESGGEKTVVTDGGPGSVANGGDGTSTGGSALCPDCAGETVNGQGLYDCLDCGWSGPR